MPRRCLRQALSCSSAVFSLPPCLFCLDRRTVTTWCKGYNICRVPASSFANWQPIDGCPIDKSQFAAAFVCKKGGSGKLATCLGISLAFLAALRPRSAAEHAHEVAAPLPQRSFP